MFRLRWITREEALEATSEAAAEAAGEVHRVLDSPNLPFTVPVWYSTLSTEVDNDKMVVTMVRKLDTGDANYYIIAKDLDIKMAWSANLASA